MKRHGFLTALAIGAGIMTFTGSEAIAASGKQCPKMQNCAMKATVQKLECGGSYFMVSDFDMFKKQLKNILSSFAGQLKTEDAMMMNMGVGIAGQVCDYIGLSDIKTIGQSSTVLGEAPDGRNTVFHNRLAILSDPAKKKPLIMQLTDGEKINLQQFAASVPNDAVSAVVFSLDVVKFYNALKNQTIAPIPPEVFDSMKQEIGISADELAAAVSGQVTVINWEFDPIAEKMSIFVKINDRGNKVFGLICKNMGLDPAATNRIALPVDEKMPIEIYKKSNSLEVYLGKDTAARMAQKIAAGATVANDPTFKVMSQKIPAQAQGYGLGTVDFGRRGLCNVSALSHEGNAVVFYGNSYYDWNGMPIAFIMNVASELIKNPEMGKMFKQLMK